ncbi:MAG: ribonuclease R [Ruthenibacterium sp.]
MSLKAKIIKELEKKPRRIKEIKAKLGNDKKIPKAMDELFHEKKLTCKDGVYAVASAKTEHALVCTIVKLGRGFGFAKPEDGSLDVFIPGKFLLGAMPGDSVMVSVFEHPRVAGSVEGEVISVLTENNRVVGTIDRVEGHLVLVPDNSQNTPLQIKKSADGGARQGEKAAGEILERGTGHADHRVGVAMRFGSSEDAAQCAKALLYGAGINRSFPLQVKAQSKQIDANKIDPAALAGRADLRDLPIFTIDAASTKDIDDAISIARNEQGYMLGVHIADVSHYVTPGTALDNEAFHRATSVYYADNVVPMLPRQLSNGICSLNEGEDRLAFSCQMQLNQNGCVTDYSFTKSIIRSRVKGVYAELNAIYDESAGADILQKYLPVAQTLPILHEVYLKLAAIRSARGSMDIESNEAKLVINEDGRCVDVVKRTRGVSEQMIEEFMLLANSSAANFATKLHIPFVYRVHASPDPERIAKLKAALTAAGVSYHFAGSEPTALELSKLLSDTRGTNMERFVHTNVLRSMAKADYEPVEKGHFGLALSDYAHFTSPIRRYPDLAIHRILSDVCAGKTADEISTTYAEFAQNVSKQASECEVIAMRVERDAEDCYKAEYMKQFIGSDFTAVISSVTSFGVYVELDNTIEGLVRAAALSPRPLTLVEGVCLKDAAGGKSWRLGDVIKVKLAAVDVSHGNLDFEPAI